MGFGLPKSPALSPPAQAKKHDANGGMEDGTCLSGIIILPNLSHLLTAYVYLLLNDTENTQLGRLVGVSLSKQCSC